MEISFDCIKKSSAIKLIVTFDFNIVNLLNAFENALQGSRFGCANATNQYQ